MINECIFIFHAIIIAISALISLLGGPVMLTTFVALQCILANLMVLKQTVLFGLTATCADPFSIGATLGLNLLQEYYGKNAAKNAIAISFKALLFYLFMTIIHLWYIPAAVDTTHNHFVLLFSVMPRIIIASFIVFYISQSCDYWLYNIFKTWWHSRFLIIRNYCSIFISQFIDTVLFSYLALYGAVDNIIHVICIAYSVKIIATFLIVPFVSLSKQFYLPRD